MYKKLLYTLPLAIGFYAGNSLAMTSRTSQLGRRAAASAPRLAPSTVGTFNRTYSTPRVVPTWQQAPTAQQTTAKAEHWSDSSKSLAQQSSYKKDYDDNSFWGRYQKLGLSAALFGLFGTAQQKELSPEEEMAALKKKDSDALDNLWKVCGHTNTTVNQALDGDSYYFLPQLKLKYPNCARALSDFCAARIALLLEELKDPSLSESARNKNASEIIKHQIIREKLK